MVTAWYRGHPLLWLLWPFSVVYALVTELRRFLYRHKWLASQRFRLPVIVVGNITVGGTGKTPLTLALISFLREQGYRPAVVSRGYGGHAEYPYQLNEQSTPAESGDEPLAIFRRTGVPVVVDPVRTRAVSWLQQHTDCNVVLCDDGLQHYALERDIEIAVIDGGRGLGNRLLLPAGPLREPVSRLASVDLVVVNGEGMQWPGASVMQLQPQPWRPLHSGASATPVPGARVHAVAGIGNPQRFFAQLQAQGFDVVPHAFADHHAYSARDFAFAEALSVVMTEKDAVKCAGFAAENWWYVPVQAVLPPVFLDGLLQRLRQVEKDHA
ncbi:MAG TPA: tetraacyldisaccharide 4'-kinase [Moraxellaceae bacterium]|nr:tetraacyldisaccharide 4'-kinase [Moraxellaceae bacterium]